MLLFAENMCSVVVLSRLVTVSAIRVAMAAHSDRIRVLLSYLDPAIVGAVVLIQWMLICTYSCHGIVIELVA